MRKFTTFGLTCACVAKGGAFVYVSFGAFAAFAAVTTITKVFADRCSWQGRRMRILAVGVGAISFGKMQTVWNPLHSEFVREIAVFTVDTSTFFQKVFADGNLVWVMLIST